VSVLAEELKSNGGKNILITYKAVFFNASEADFYRCHLNLRTASRLFRVIKEIPAKTPTIIFDKAKRIRWDLLFKAEDHVKLTIMASGNNSGDVAGHLIGSKVREAITDCFIHHKTPELSSFEAKIQIVGFLQNNRLMLSIDTSLHSLHKRAYRIEGHPAPLKETLAAALLRLCKYDGSTPFLDPMCGSGTIAIEAAMIAINKSPLIHRSKGEFGLEYLLDFNRKLWKDIQDQERAKQALPIAEIFARDIDPSFLELAQKTALKARVEKYMTFQQKDFFASTKPAPEGLLIVNLPYGLRLDDDAIDAEYLQKLGIHLKEHFQGWHCGILLPEKAPYKALGLKSNGQWMLLNGMIKVRFLSLEIRERPAVTFA
jgi:putative N6-adenine-specific DNA methylase